MLHPSDNRHSANSAKNSDENQVAAIQRNVQPKTREQGQSAPMSVAPYPHTICELNAGK